MWPFATPPPGGVALDGVKGETSWVWHGFAISLLEPDGARTFRTALRRDLFTELDLPSLAPYLQTLRLAERLRESPAGRILLLRPDASPQVWLADLRLPFA